MELWEDLALEIVVAAVAVVGLSFAGEPPLALPNVANTFLFLQEGHPGVNANQHSQSNHPLDWKKNEIEPSKQNEPKQTFGAVYAGDLYFGAAALRTLNI